MEPSERPAAMAEGCTCRLEFLPVEFLGIESRTWQRTGEPCPCCVAWHDRMTELGVSGERREPERKTRKPQRRG